MHNFLALLRHHVKIFEGDWRGREPESDQGWGNSGLALCPSGRRPDWGVTKFKIQYSQLNSKMLDKNRTPGPLPISRFCLFSHVYMYVLYNAKFRLTFLRILSINALKSSFTLYSQVFPLRIQCLTTCPLLRHANCLNANPTPPASSSRPSNLLFAARGNPRHHLVAHRPTTVPEPAAVARLEETGLQNGTGICPWEHPPRNTYGESPIHPPAPAISPISNTTIHAEDADVRTQ